MTAGSGEAAFNLATMYARGEGVRKSWETAVRLMRRADKLGSTDANVFLAEMHIKGAPNIRRDMVSALCHSVLAMIRGDPRGQRILGKILTEGEPLDSRKVAAALSRCLKKVL